MKMMLLLALLVFGSVSLAAQAAAPVPNLFELERMIARFAPTQMRVDVTQLSPGDRKALVKLIEAAKVINDIFLTQLWSGNRALYSRLQKDRTPLGRARLHYFWINKGPWSDLDGGTAFIPGGPPHKLPGANFYPEDMTKAEFEKWLSTLAPDQQEDAKGYFTAIRRRPDRKLTMVPYSLEYRAELERAATLLREAASLTDNATLKRFLSTRADAFLSNNYFDSDIAWMELDAPLDITIGPYETYLDDLFGYKAYFEAFINLRDERETAKLAAFARDLQVIENNLPIEPQYRNPKLGAAAPIRVVNEVFAAGDRGVQTAAYNLPNDERVILQKGSKRVMLKNVQEAKFRSVLLPISVRTLARSAQPDVSFNMFFTHILAHELMHGLGPHRITVGGRESTVRKEMKELYGAIEEAKADATGLFALQYMMDHARELKLEGVLPSDEAAQRQLYTTFLASSFRTLRFGIKEAHGRGMAVQVNYLLDRGGFVAQPDGTFAVDFKKISGAVRDLTHDLLTLEATGDYAGAKKMLDTLGVIRPEVKRALDKLTSVPTDVEPVFVTAEELTNPQPVRKWKPPTKRRRRR
jgi:hypothetical protein